MDKSDAVRIVREFASKQFPRDCSCCGKHYASLRDYVRDTTPVGKPVSYDAENQDWNPTRPIGTISMANCTCGSTLSVDSAGIPLTTLWALMKWAKSESKERNMGMRDLLDELRAAIDQSVLEETD